MNKLKYSFQMFIKMFVKLHFLRVYKVRYVMKNFNPKRKGPYFLIGNHVLPLDALFSSFAIKGYGIPVVSSFVFMNFWRRMALTHFIETIVKRKGQSDIQTIKNIRKHINKGHVVQVYPAGNTSYYGESSESVYATAKLFKLQKIDVVCAKTKGGYFAKPRWRETRIKRAYLEIEMFLLFKSEELKDMSINEIYNKMHSSYYQNDYIWNKEAKIEYKGKNRLEGSHLVIYGCPKCNSINQMNSKGDSIYCEECGETGTINNYGFIEGTKFDNFVDWGRYQEDLLKQNLDKKFEFSIELYKIDLLLFRKTRQGHAKLVYDKGKFYVKSEKVDFAFDIKKMVGVVYTERDELSFDYNNETFLFVTDKPKLLLDITKYIKEDLNNV